MNILNHIMAILCALAIANPLCCCYELGNSSKSSQERHSCCHSDDTHHNKKTNQKQCLCKGLNVTKISEIPSIDIPSQVVTANLGNTWLDQWTIQLFGDTRQAQIYANSLDPPPPCSPPLHILYAAFRT